MRMRRWLLAAAITVPALAGACSGGGDASSPNTTIARDAAGGAGAGLGSAAKLTAGQPVDPSQPTTTTTPDARKLIYTADLTVRVGSVVKGVADATRAAQAAGGVVFAQTVDLEGERNAHLTIKVPPEQFDPLVSGLAGLGRVLSRQTQAQDVTDEVVDLAGRLKTAQASADRLRALLAQAKSTSDIVSIEGELTRRESEIESMAGRLRVLEAQVDMATIELRLTEKGDAKVSKDLPGPLRALKLGWVTLVNIAIVAVAVAAFLLPFVPLLFLGWLVVRRVFRWLRDKDQPPHPPPAA